MKASMVQSEVDYLPRLSGETYDSYYRRSLDYWATHYPKDARPVCDWCHPIRRHLLSESDYMCDECMKKDSAKEATP